MAYWRSHSYFDIPIKAEYHILTFKILFDIQTPAKYRFLTFNILFWNSDQGRTSNFDIHNPILTFEIRPNFVIDTLNPILTIEIRSNIVFDVQNPIFYIRTTAKNHIQTLEFLLWHPNLGRMSREFLTHINYFDARNEVKYNI